MQLEARSSAIYLIFSDLELIVPNLICSLTHPWSMSRLQTMNDNMPASLDRSICDVGIVADLAMAFGLY